MLKTHLIYLLLQILILLNCAVQSYAQDMSEIQLADQYLQQGESDKALSLYEKLEKDYRNIPLIHEKYYQLMITTGKFDEAEKYIDKAIKRYPSNIYYQIDKGLIYQQKNNKTEAKKYFEKLISDLSNDPFKVRVAAQHFTKNQQYDYAAELYLQSRKKVNDPLAYSIQMASLYRLMNKKQEMIDEYLNYVLQNPNNIRSVENIFQNILQEDEDLELFESMMYDKVQKNPSNQVYNDLLIWVSLQRKNFYSAFIQARAIDKRNKLGGNELLEIGRIAMENKDYKNAIRIFEYIVSEYNQTPNYQISRRLLITCREEIVKHTYPVDEKAIRVLINDYNELINDIGINQTSAQALRSQALLYAFYLHEYDSAIAILQRIINAPRISKSIVDQSKLDLGDIYILIDEPWESTLLYSQVEKSGKETPIGYEAKLRNAKLSFYRGDFELAQSHLDILKMATTREIANDAMSLSLLIKDNTQLDTGDVAMKRYVQIDLMIFQNKKEEAFAKLTELKNDFPDHPLVDEILYKQAELMLEKGDFFTSITLLQEIVDKHGNDILGDDALFLIGIIYQDQLADKELAMGTFKTFLKQYPGSNRAAEARKRFRTLRGDFL